MDWDTNLDVGRRVATFQAVLSRRTRFRSEDSVYDLLAFPETSSSRPLALERSPSSMITNAWKIVINSDSGASELSETLYGELKRIAAQHFEHCCSHRL